MNTTVSSNAHAQASVHTPTLDIESLINEIPLLAYRCALLRQYQLYEITIHKSAHAEYDKLDGGT